jgi:molybdopterin converting factor small subunit
VRFFGRLTQEVGSDLELGGETSMSVAELRQSLAAQYPRAASVLKNERSRVCLRNEFVSDEHRLYPHDEVEILAPVSGG